MRFRRVLGGGCVTLICCASPAPAPAPAAPVHVPDYKSRAGDRERCFIGSVDTSIQEVPIEELCRNGSRYANTRVRVVGVVVDLFEMNNLVSVDGKCAISAEWPSGNIHSCGARKVTAEGVIRQGTEGSRHGDVLVVEGVEDWSVPPVASAQSKGHDSARAK
jgi:hypothetical protein